MLISDLHIHVHTHTCTLSHTQRKKGTSSRTRTLNMVVRYLYCKSCNPSSLTLYESVALSTYSDVHLLLLVSSSFISSVSRQYFKINHTFFLPTNILNCYMCRHRHTGYASVTTYKLAHISLTLNLNYKYSRYLM